MKNTISIFQTLAAVLFLPLFSSVLCADSGKNGYTVQGTVRDEAGQPIEGATVFGKLYLGERSGQFDTAKTGPSGTFEFKDCTNRNDLFLAVRADGFAPDMVDPLKISDPMPPVDFVLKPGATLRLRTVDPRMEPVYHISITVERWRGRYFYTDIFFPEPPKRQDEAAGQYTDEKGQWIWENAPAEEITLDLTRLTGDLLQPKPYKRRSGYVSTKRGDEEDVVTTYPGLDVSGKLTDAETGEPVEEFKIVFGHQLEEDGDIYWHPQHPEFQKLHTARLPKGTYRYTSDYLCHRQYVRIDVDGYENAVTRPIKPEEGEISIDLELRKVAEDSPARMFGQILTPDGKPAEDATIGLAFNGNQANVFINNGHFGGMGTEFYPKTDAEGRFDFLTTRRGLEPGTPYRIVVCHESGYAEMDDVEFDEKYRNKTDAPLRLTPFGRIEGTAMKGSEPLKNAEIDLSMSHIYNKAFKDRWWESPSVYFGYRTQTDDEGRFVFEKVVSRKGSLSTKMGLSAGYIVPLYNIPVEVKPEETVSCVLGGEGRPVTGRLEWGEDFDKKTDWNRIHAMAFEQDKPGRNESRGAQVDEEGRFRFENIRPGRWEIMFVVRGPGDSGSSEELGGYSGEITVEAPEDGKEYIETPQDVGEITLKPRQKQ